MDLNKLSNQYLLPLIVVLAFLVAGFVLEKIVDRIMKKFLGSNKYENSKNFAGSIHGMILTTFACLGLYTAAMQLNLDQNIRDTIRALMLTLIIFLVTSGASRIATAFVKLYQGKYKGMVSSISIFASIAKLLIYTIGLLIILQTLGISITPILTALGVGGLAVALALKDSLANLFAGLHIIASGQLKAGDYVKIAPDAEGHILDINWRSTVLKTLSHNEVIIPNSKVAEAIITNYSRPEHEISVSLAVPVSYSNDFAGVQKAALEAAKSITSSHPSAVASVEPSAKFSSFNDASASLNVSIRCKNFTEQFALKDELLKALHRKFAEEKIILAQTTA